MSGRIKDFRVTVRLRNNQLVARREQLGLSPPAAAAAIGIGYQLYLDYESMRASPFRRHTAELRGSAGKIVAFYGVLPEELWPAAVQAVERTVLTRCFDAGELCQLGVSERTCALPAPDEVVAQRELARAVGDVLATLTAREQLLLRHRVGLAAPPPETDRAHWTLEEVAALLGVQRERARQIEGVALRKLRGRSRIEALLPFIQEGA